MLRLALLVVAVLGFGFNSSAEAEPPELFLLLPGSFQRLPSDPKLLYGRTHFRRLKSEFEKAVAPTIESLSGWYAGRCFFLDSPTRGVAALIAVDTAVDNKMNGPAFSSADYRRVVPLISREAPPDYFDQVNPKNEANIRRAVARLIATNAYPVRHGGSLLIEGMRSPDAESREYELRRDKQFLFLKLTCSEQSYCMNYLDEVPTNRVLAYEGEIPAMCYYFKRVKK